jgi:ATP-dependent helicase/nuclease subunit A
MQESGWDDLRQRDARARELAQREFGRPLVIEAGAGTGKTTTLTARILSWCMGPGWERAEEEGAGHRAQGTGLNAEGGGNKCGVWSAECGEEERTNPGVRSQESGRRSAECGVRSAERGGKPDAKAEGRSERRTSHWIPENRNPVAEPERVSARVLDGVVAITFTDAAAAEMAARVGEALAQVERGEWPPGLLPEVLPASPALRQSRARALLGALDHLVVMTIHAFCFRLLMRYPMEAGLHPSISVDADGTVLELVAREVLEDALKVAYGEPGDPHFLALAAQGQGPQELGEALMRLASQALPEEVLREDPFSPERIRALCDDLLERLRAVESAGGGRLSAIRGKRSVTRDLTALIEETRQRVEAMANPCRPHIESFCAWVKGAWTANALTRLRKWGKGELNKAEAVCLGESASHLSECVGPLLRLLEHVARLDPGFLEHARLALGPLLQKVHEEMRARGAQTFMGLLRDARDLLRSHPEVRRTVRRSIDQLLVDEFQDTDPLQCDIVRMIALDGAEDERPGLFIVGDPKQSIYGWRNADLQAYDDFVAEVLQHGGGRDPLAVNFRSAPVILREVERVIGPVMTPEIGLQPPFEPLLPSSQRAGSPGFDLDPRAPVEYWVSWARGTEGRMLMEKTRTDQAAEIEAAALARDILALHHEHGLPWQEVGVLFRSMGDLDTYLAAFREAEIPYVVARDRNYYRRREVIEAAALVRCVLDPHDHVALLTFLRSAMVGVPDAAWIPLWSRSFPERITEIQGEDPERLDRVRAVVARAAEAILPGTPGIDRVAGWERSLLAAIQHIGILRESFHCDPADRFVARMRGLCLADTIESARYLGPYRLANLDRFFRHLTQALDQGGGDPQAILRGLRTGVVQGLEAEEGRPKEAAEEAVQVMTIHKAKGLDFRHVFVLQLHKGTRTGADDGTAVAWHRGRWEYSLAGAPTLGYVHVLERNRAVADAELVRTLYVAMTRAKDRLIMAGRWPKPGSGDPVGSARTHMGLLRGREPESPSLEAMMQEAADRGGAVHEDRAGARWVFPGLLGADCPMPIESGDTVRLPSPERVQRDAEVVGERIKAARALMARPFSQPASEGSHESLREIMAESAEPEFRGAMVTGQSPARSGPGEEQRVAMAAGSGVHRALECFDLTSDPHAELNRQDQLLPRYIGFDLAEDERALALAKARFLLDRFAKGPLFPRFLGLRDQIIARELPVLLPPSGDELGSVGFVSGTIDLLYRDAETGEMVVADYKTDMVETAEEIAERARAYAAQGGLYVRAVQEALNLSHPPRFALWFIHPGLLEFVPQVAASQSTQGS